MAMSLLEAEFKQILLNLLVDCWPFIPDINIRPTTKKQSVIMEKKRYNNNIKST